MGIWEKETYLRSSFCIKCGVSLLEKPRIGNLCIDCYLDFKKPLCVEERVEFDYCKICGAYRIGYRWYDGGELLDAIMEFIDRYHSENGPGVEICDEAISSYNLENKILVTEASWRTIVELVYSFTLSDSEMRLTLPYRVIIRARPTLCPTCKNIRGGDYNVLVQLRGESPETLAKLLTKLFEKNKQISNSIVDIVELPNGVDIYLLDRGSASKIVSLLKRRYRLSIKKTGEDITVTSTGHSRRRLIISVRLKRRSILG